MCVVNARLKYAADPSSKKFLLCLQMELLYLFFFKVLSKEDGPFSMYINTIKYIPAYKKEQTHTTAALNQTHVLCWCETTAVVA